MEKIHDYTIKLIRYVLAGEKPDLPKDIDFRELREFGLKHGVENMLYVALSELGIDVPKPIMDELQEDYEMQIVAEATQAYELEEMRQRFETEGIDHVPLKGSVIKYIYPMPDYRKSGDIDLLIRNKDRQRLKEIMADLGYSEKPGEGNDIHDEYEKPPIMAVELHHTLIGYNGRSHKFCDTAWDYAHLCEGSQHEYRLTNEFFYTHLIAHLCEHLYHGGAGIRLFADIYLFTEKYKLDEALLRDYLKKANLAKANELIVALTDKWFRGRDTDDKTIETLESIVLNGGSFGTAEQAELMKSSNTRGGKLYILLRQIFPSKPVLKSRYPEVAEKYDIWLVLWLYRVYYMIRYRRSIMKERSADALSAQAGHNGMTEILKAVRDI